MNSDKKESISIAAIINEVNKFDNLQEDLKRRDKGPVWDGELCLYKGESNKTNEIAGRIPVQVKGLGKAVDKKEDTINYRVKISDIENYKKDKRGAIFFVVAIFENRETAIYYKMFDIETIDNILSSIDIGLKTKKFEFKILEKNKLLDISIDFIEKLDVYESIKRINKIEVYDKKIICYDDNTKNELEEIKKSNQVFFETNAYREAKEKLEKQNIIILHGEPWVGKTSTARRLVMDYIDKGYLFLHGGVDDLVEIKTKIATEGKMICVLDDFLGSNIQYLEKNVAENTLDKIISVFKNSKDKKLIMTSRTYIYNNSKHLFYKFYHATGIKDEYLIDVANYSYLEKGSILYNHLEKNGLLGTTQYKQILEDEFYEEIIEHENFNPGVISLICENMREEKSDDIRAHIRERLKDPEKLWEGEYEKLTIYEKMILIITVLFGVKVPESYVKEQFQEIVKNENIQAIEGDIFSKSIDKLTLAFIKITFNEEGEREQEVCKHSIADYIISKIKKEQVDIKRYIESARYVEVLHYIDMIIRYEQEDIKELLAKKVEKDFDTLESFHYDRVHILYGILERKITPKREKILQESIVQAFKIHNTSLIISILDHETDALYPFTLNMFKKYVIDTNEEEHLYRIGYVHEYETYIQTCLMLLNYQKNSEYAMVNFYDIEESLIGVVSEDIGNTIEEIMIEDVAKDVIKGRTMEDIKIGFIHSVVNDEIPSLSRMYSKKEYKKILKFLCKFCYMNIDKELLERTIEEIKSSNDEKNIDFVNNNLTISEAEQKKYIEMKFKGDIESEQIDLKKEKKIDYREFARYLRLEVNREWWQDRFIDDYISYYDNCENYPSLVLYYEFIKEKKDIDYSMKHLAKEFLDFVYEKYNISKEVDEILRKIIYINFINGNLEIDEAIIRKYEEEYPKIMKKIYSTNLIFCNDEKYYCINEYIYLYIGLEEVKNRKCELMCIIDSWNENELYTKVQEILQIYSEMDRINFNDKCVIQPLTVFISMIKKEDRINGKMRVSREIIDLFDIEVYLDDEFNVVSNLSNFCILSCIISFVTGSEIEWDIGLFEYSIYQEELYQKCYDEEEEMYILNFKDILKDKSLRNICSSIKVWNYLYDVYLICVEVLEELKKHPEMDVYHFGQSRLIEKYYI